MSVEQENTENHEITKTAFLRKIVFYVGFESPFGRPDLGDLDGFGGPIWEGQMVYGVLSLIY
jgi:hypothetical protein